MSCPYYWYNYHYACRKSGKDVNEDTYDKYCKNYDYSDCPIYKGNDTSSCFLTSACVEAKGLPDNCYELETLRTFRDNYMKKLPCGSCEVAEYYTVAPKIVDQIQKLSDSLNVFESIYSELVLPCVSLIEKGENEAAHCAYRSYVLKLRETYLPEY